VPGNIDGALKKHIVKDCKGFGICSCGASGEAAKDVVHKRGLPGSNSAKPCVRCVSCPCTYVTQAVFIQDFLELCRCKGFAAVTTVRIHCV
jgi:hypothetical protein